MLKTLSEVLTLAIVCLTPWAFGSVDAWAGFGLGVAILVLTVLTTASTWKSDRIGRFWCVPSLALAGLVLLGLLQITPLPAPLARVLAPSESAFRSSLVPERVERVAGDTRAPVPSPPMTLSQNPEATRSATGRLVAAWLLFQAVLCLNAPRSAFRRFGVATAVNACLLATFSVIQWLSWNGKVLWIREAPHPESPWYSGGPFASHNHLAAYLNLGLGFALGLLLSSAQGNPWFAAKRGARLWPAYGVGVLLVGLVASHSRGGVLAAAGALVITLLVSRTQSRPLVRASLLIPAIGFLGLVLAVAMLTFLGTGNRSPFARLASLTDPGSDIRWVVWRLAIPAWWDRPVWGAGLGCFSSAISLYETLDYGYTYARAENEYLDILIEGGGIGFGLALTALGGSALLAGRALAATRVSHERALILGAIFGGLALSFQWLVDFSFHIPAVAVSAVVMAGFLCRIGIDSATISGSSSPVRRRASCLLGLTLPVLGLVLLGPAYRQARAEYTLWNAGLALPDAARQQDRWDEREKPEVERGTVALGRALKLRPDWAGGHLRMGAAFVRLYELTAAELIRTEESDPGRVAILSQPLWLRNQVHDGTPGLALPIESLLEQGPIRSYLVPAARSLLEARRCAPVQADPHLELANLDYLLEPGPSAAVSTRRALRLAGANRRVLEIAAILSVQVGDLGLASECWRKTLGIDDRAWEQIADSAAEVLTPDAILRDVLPPDDGLLPIRFADRLYGAPVNRPSKVRFLEAALERLPDDPRLPAAARLYFRGIAHARLGHNDQALSLIEEALMLEPMEQVFRKTFVEFLVESGQWKSARAQIAIGLELHPGDPELSKARERVLDALARGDPAVPPQFDARPRMAVGPGDR